MKGIRTENRLKNTLSLSDQYRAADMAARTFGLLFLDAARTTTLRAGPIGPDEIEGVEKITQTLKEMLFQATIDARWGQEILKRHRAAFRQGGERVDNFDFLVGNLGSRVRRTLGDPAQISEFLERIPGEVLESVRDLEEQMSDVRQNLIAKGDISKKGACAIGGLGIVAAFATGLWGIAIGFASGVMLGYCLKD